MIVTVGFVGVLVRMLVRMRCVLVMNGFQMRVMPLRHQTHHGNDDCEQKAEYPETEACTVHEKKYAGYFIQTSELHRI